MAIKLEANGFSLVQGSMRHNLGKVAKMVGHETALTGYGAFADSDIGYVATKTYETLETIRSFAAIPMADEAKHSAFAVFRDAVADEAERMAAGTPIGGNMSAATQVGNGSAYTGFYNDLISGQMAVQSDLLNNDPNQIEAKLDYSNVNWNDAQSKADYLSNIQEYANTAGLRDHAGLISGDPKSSANELRILLHTSNKEEYAAYIHTFESAIQQNFERELKSAQEYARQLGYQGSLSNVKDMQKFANTLNDVQKAAMENLIKMTDGSINKVDRYILARIKSGNIDIQTVLSTGTFNGVKLDDKALKAFAALNVYAHSDSIASEYLDKTLRALGEDPGKMSLNLNKLKNDKKGTYIGVEKKLEQFEKALAKAGYGAFDTKTMLSSNGKKAKSLKYMSLKQLRNIKLEMIQNEDVRNALKQYINLREHAKTLDSAAELKGNMQMRVTQLVRKALGDSDLSRGIGQIQTQIHNVNFAMKIVAKSPKFLSWIGDRKAFKFAGKVLKGTAKAIHTQQVKILKTVLKDKYQILHNSPIGEAGRAARKEARAAKKTAKQTARQEAAKTKAAAKKATNAGKKHATKLAKKQEKKLLEQAGKQAGKWTRRAGHLAQHGAIGTTGAGAAGSGAAAGAGAGAAGAGAAGAAGTGTAGAAGGAAGGGALGVCALVLLIVVLVSLLCQIIGGVCVSIGQSAAEFDNTLIGKMADWIDDFRWPWDNRVRDEERENVLWYTLYTLIDEEVKASNVGTVIGSADFNGGYMPAVPGTEGYGAPSFDGASTSNGGTTIATLLNTDKAPDQLSWTKPKYNSDNIDSNADTYWVYTNAETGEPINEYSNIKLCLSMAHAFTYHIETKDQIEDFSTYAVGLWHYLNDVKVTANLEMCSGDGYFTYYCDQKIENSAFYSELSATHNHDSEIFVYNPGDKVAITVNTPHRFYVVGGSKHLSHTAANMTHQYTAFNRSSLGGCVYKVHNNKTGYTYEKDRTNTGLAGPSCTLSLVTASSLGKWDLNKATPITTEYVDKNGNRITYKLDPIGVKECFPSGQITATQITTCGTTSRCSNCEIRTVYTKKTTSGYCGTTRNVNNGTITTTWHLSNSLKCQHGAPNHKTKSFYVCKGHDELIYCDGYATIGYFTRHGTGKNVQYKHHTISHSSWTKSGCDNCTKQIVYKKSGGTETYELYTCNGHKNHGVFTSDAEQYKNVCKKTTYVDIDHNPSTPDVAVSEPCYETKSYYVCNGYTKTTYTSNGQVVYLCKGHYSCPETGSEHNYCPGHKLTYCKGHISYVVSRSIINSTSEAIFSDEWTHTVTGKFLWWEVNTTYTPKKYEEGVSPPGGMESLARGDWDGWTDNNKELMNVMYNSDWYLSYDIGLGTFTGAQCSKYEKSHLKKQFNISPETTTEQLMMNLDFALDACGQVCYYPGDKAVAEGYSALNRFNTAADVVFDDNNVQRGVHGLDPMYFADWVYRSTHGNYTHSALHSSFHKNTTAVHIRCKAGTPIVYRGGGDTRTGILIGAFDNEGILCIQYVGIDSGTNAGGGWVTVLTEPAAGWYYNMETM